jgi:hypothetical protein
VEAARGRPEHEWMLSARRSRRLLVADRGGMWVKRRWKWCAWWRRQICQPTRRLLRLHPRRMRQALLLLAALLAEHLGLQLFHCHGSLLSREASSVPLAICWRSGNNILQHKQLHQRLKYKCDRNTLFLDKKIIIAHPRTEYSLSLM